MPDRERDAAIKRLRRFAELALAEQRCTISIVRNEHELPRTEYPYFLKMTDAWRDFPECERDEVCPSPEEVLLRCDSYDRQKEEAERIAARGI